MPRSQPTRRWWLVGLLVLVVGAILWSLYTYTRRGQEGFQAPAAPAVRSFEELLAAADSDEAVANKLKTVMYGQEGDNYTMVFPRVLAVFSLSQQREDPIVARQRLILNYNRVYNDFITSARPTEAAEAKWAINPRQETCRQVGLLKEKLTAQIAGLRAKVQDLSGTQVVAGQMKEENLRLQGIFAAGCTKNLTPDCMSLASQDEKLFPLLAEYEGVNKGLLEEEINVQETLKVVRATYDLLQCDKAATAELSYDLIKQVGYIDTKAMLEKLGMISPYYLSPASLQYIQRLLPGAEEVEDATEEADENTQEMLDAVEETGGILE